MTLIAPEVQDLDAVEVAQPSRLKSATKRVVLWLYDHHLMTFRMTQVLWVRLRLRDA